MAKKQYSLTLIGLGLAVLGFVFSFLADSELGLIIPSLLEIAGFVLSIIGTVKKDYKKLAITGIVVTSLLLLIFILASVANNEIEKEQYQQEHPISSLMQQ
ncbi:hypothetical protein [Latilactobacillus sakei]|uniref:Uncharacterized protein n=1 Tax=Latilactobacillus sakei TaxID=1599 RepID=A0AAX0VAS7_LATSK|nr:hypothetical protein [Latilactobacillus sakei]ASN12944.1 hypothetical protein B4V05_06900 [Latilactobacillus sakei]MCM1635691.1 hypothetical protein [Latilactobacillus sakei]PKX61315.1 hypothetical protein CUR39_05075 [Latilactobacillus sakei]PKX69590.1 hypothetical protein CUR36_07670 [Latilactobacillus sakei]PKX72181.1 hypothetical protein CUR35_03985 [Latilactobacillus sakei]